MRDPFCMRLRALRSCKLPRIMSATPGAPQRYRIVETIGRGGMGEVCLAVDLMLDRRVALKFPTARVTNGHPVEQLLAEARAAAALDHPFICKIHEVTEIDGRPCIAMEYVQADTLEHRLARGPLPLAEVLRLGDEIAEALEAAHRRRLVHRDLKPANIIVTDDGHIKVMDFGLAVRLELASDGADATNDARKPDATSAVTSTCWGTPAYMAPEQIQGRAADRRSDIFSFGVLLYQLLSGRHPFLCLSVESTIASILEDEPKDLREQAPDMPPPVAAVIARMLAKSPAARYQSFGDVRLELRRLAGQLASAGIDRKFLVERSAAMRDRRFVGRESACAELLRPIDEARNGRGGLVIIQGEAGIGKSRLAEEALSRARHLGVLTLVGRCHEQEGTPPLVPYAEVIEDAARLLPASIFRDIVGPTASELARLAPEFHRLFPDMPAPLELPGDLRQRYLFHNMRDFLARCSRVVPVAVFLDDLQWADPSTLQLTQFLAEHLGKLPAILVCACRELEVEAEAAIANPIEALMHRLRGRKRPAAGRDPQATINQLLERRLARVISLPALNESGVAGMLTALGGHEAPPRFVRRFLDQTGGNPFFIEELFRCLCEDDRLFDRHGRWRRDVELENVEVPAGIRTVISTRLRRISKATHEVLTAAAVLGSHFDAELLEAVAAIDNRTLTAALEEAEKAHLLMGPAGRTERRWRFAHQLIGKTLASALPPSRRERLHLRAADAIAPRETASYEHTADLAHHLYCAGRTADPWRTARALLAAGDAADALYATDDAIRHYRRALEIFVELNDVGQDRSRVQERLADLEALAGDRATAMRRFSELVTLHDRTGNSAGRSRAVRKIGVLHWQSGDRVKAVEYYQRALETLDGQTDHIEAAQVYQELALAAFRSGDNRGALEWAERALRAAEGVRTADLTPDARRTAAAAVAHATNTIGVALIRTGNVEAGRDHIERSIAAAHQHGLLDVACRGYANLGVLYSMSEPKEAIAVSQLGLELATTIGATSLQSYIYANLAAAYCTLTDQCDTEGLQAARTAAQIDRQLEQLDHLAVPLIVMGQILQCRGELRPARESYEEALTLAEKAGEPQLLFPCYDGLATIYLDAGDRTRAEHYMAKARDVCDRAGIDPDTLCVLPFLC